MDLKQERQLSFVEALKALDDEKMEEMYRQSLKDIAETVLDVEFDENNEPMSDQNAEC